MTRATVDGNEAAVSVAYRLNEVCCIYPITPSSPMAELADEWSSAGRPNVWGTVPTVVEMQSEGGAAGALHGALQSGALTTTFTSSQGLLLMIPNMYKIAGELTSAVINVAARSLAAQGLSIFGDHSDVMAVRQTGFALLASASVQEAHDLALVAQAATLTTRVPFVHFFDGFRTSHELNTIETLSDDDLRALVPEELVWAHRGRALSPERPFIRGTAQNPDVYFQARETVNPFYARVPGVVEDLLARLGERTGRKMHIVDYSGHPEAQRVLVVMGSGAETVVQTVAALVERGERVGVVQVRLYRPFPTRAFLEALPATVRTVGVLDRTKEPGSIGEPLYLDVVAALAEAHADGERPVMPRVTRWTLRTVLEGVHARHGRRGVRRTRSRAAAPPIHRRYRRRRLRYQRRLRPVVRHRVTRHGPGDLLRAGFGRNGQREQEHDQDPGVRRRAARPGILRLRLEEIGFADRVASTLRAGSHPRPLPRDWSQFRWLPPVPVSRQSRRAGSGCPGRDAAAELSAACCEGLGRSAPAGSGTDPGQADHAVHRRRRPDRSRGRAGRADQHRFADMLLRDLATCCPASRRSPGSRNRWKRCTETAAPTCCAKELAAVDGALDGLHRIEVPTLVTSTRTPAPTVPESAPEFVRTVTAEMMAGRGNALPVSALPVDGSYPSGTTAYEKRNISELVAVWDAGSCIQCGNCGFVCPHSVIRSKYYDQSQLAGAPDQFDSAPLDAVGLPNARYSLQVYVEDCTGCGLCVEACPVVIPGSTVTKAINLGPSEPRVIAERENITFFETLPTNDRSRVDFGTVRGTQFLEPLFEFSGACAGCGETPYLKLLSQLFGDRLMIANATGCSSIYGGSLPTTPWTTDADGRGPAWSNSLFEDNAEFGLGMRLASDGHAQLARRRLAELRDALGHRTRRRHSGGTAAAGVGVGSPA